MRVFSGLLSWSNKIRSCMIVDESFYESFLTSHMLLKVSNKITRCVIDHEL